MADTVITSVVNTPSAEIANKTFVASTYTAQADLKLTLMPIDRMFPTKGQVFAKVDSTNSTEDRELIIPITG